MNQRWLACNGVMWRLMLLWLSLWLPVTAAAQFGVDDSQFPALTGRVVDQADLLSSSVEAELVAQLQAHEAQTSNQIVVVTIPSLGGQPISDYGYQLGRHWQIGQAGKNNGVLLIVAVGDREMRIEVGYGLEGALNDGVASDIIRHYITPPFKQGDFEGGIQSGVDQILKAIDGEYEEIGNRPQIDPAGKFFLLLFPVIFSLPLLSTIGRFWAGEKDVFKADDINRRLFPALLFGVLSGFMIWSIMHIVWLAIIFGLLIGLNVLLSESSVSSGRSGSYRGGGFGGGGFGGSSGGGFSGGGGSFGGGGASGGW